METVYSSKKITIWYQIFLLCEANSGYIWSMIIYTGKGTILDDKYKDRSIPTQVILTLIELLFDKGYCVTTDNFYTSLELAEILIHRKTDIYRTNRQNWK